MVLAGLHRRARTSRPSTTRAPPWCSRPRSRGCRSPCSRRWATTAPWSRPTSRRTSRCSRAGRTGTCSSPSTTRPPWPPRWSGCWSRRPPSARRTSAALRARRRCTGTPGTTPSTGSRTVYRAHVRPRPARPVSEDVERARHGASTRARAVVADGAPRGPRGRRPGAPAAALPRPRRAAVGHDLAVLRPRLAPEGAGAAGQGAALLHAARAPAAGVVPPLLPAARRRRADLRGHAVLPVPPARAGARRPHAARPRGSW